MIPGWWKLAAAAALALWLGVTGYWLKGLVEEAGQAEVLREQIKANRSEQERQQVIAQAAEAELAAERKRYAELTRKWSKIREAETHSVCTLDDDTLGLLREATNPGQLLPR